MCTYNTCYMSFDEAERGSMEAGKIADMVILSGNLYETDVTKLDTLKAEQLILRGEPYRKVEQNPVEQVLRGIVRK
jgi:predicted amidohydrolase YtcJ